MSPTNTFDRTLLLFLVSAASSPLVACTDENGARVVDGSAAVSSVADAGADAGADASTTAFLACDNPGDPINPAAVLSDFEDGSAELGGRQGRTGSWWVTGDMTAGGVVKPRGQAIPEVMPQPRCGSTRALHVTGSGFLDWGANLSVSLNWGANDAGAEGSRAWNASAYQGLTFWARVGATSGNSVRIGIGDQYEQPEGGFCTDGGGGGLDCYDTFGVDLPYLDTTWRKYKIYFSDLNQRGFGFPSPTGKLDTSALYHVELAMPAGAIFDLWFDDPTFF